MKTRAFIFIVLAGIFWGTSGIFVHFLAPYGFSSIQMTAMRATVSFVVMAVYVVIKNRGLFFAKPKEILLFFGSGLSFLLTATFYYTSMQLSSVATAVVLMYTAPAIVMVYSVLFLGEKLTKLKGVAVAVMLSVKWIGILTINSLLILPAAAARNVSLTSKQYHFYSLAIGLFSGIAGLIVSFYADTSAGASMVLVSAVIYFATLLMKNKIR